MLGAIAGYTQKMIDQTTFNKAVDEFDKRERRTDFFALASNLMKKGFEVEAHALLLATWNFARFRYAVKEFDIEQFRQTLRALNTHFNALKDQAIESVDLNKHKANISAIFDALSKIKGIEFTGAPKLMHLTNPGLFVMWDDYIRGAKPKKYYLRLPIFQNGDWLYSKYPKDAGGYLQFLNDVQQRFGSLRPPSGTKTLAKAIDEFNYVQITLPIQQMEKESKQKRERK
jgi:hypothetical protein